MKIKGQKPECQSDNFKKGGVNENSFLRQRGKTVLDF